KSARVKNNKTARVAIGGMGPVGRTIAKKIDEGFAPYELTAVSVRRPDRLEPFLEGFHSKPEIVALGDLAENADIDIECARAAVFEEHGQPVLVAGKDLIVLSSGALLDNWHLVDLAAQRGGSIHVPTGALLGLDAVQAAAMDEIHSVKMVTNKPPRGL